MRKPLLWEVWSWDDADGGPSRGLARGNRLQCETAIAAMEPDPSGPRWVRLVPLGESFDDERGEWYKV